MEERTVKYVIGGLVVLLVGLLALQVWVEQKEATIWEAFALEHHCYVVERTTPDTSTMTGITSSGDVVFGVVPHRAQTAYKCDDGITYWR